MKTLLFKVEGQRITRIDNIIPVAKCRNLYKAHFDFLTPEWEGTKTAIFSQRNYSKAQILDEKNECMIPWEFFDTEINIRGSVTVFCGDLVTANSTYVDIEKAGYQNSDATVPPTPDVHQQMIDILNAAKKIAQGVRDDADAGKFHGENGESAYQIAIRLGFRGTEQEWIESLEYDHSEEFTKLAAEVRNTTANIVAERQQITQNTNDVTKLKEDLTKLTKNEFIDLSKVSFEKGKYVNANTGRLEDISSGETSDFIDVHNLKKITILNYSNPDLLSYLKNIGMAFYDKNKLKTTAIQYSSTNNMTVEVSGYYFRFTKFGNPNGTVIHIDNFWEEHISDFSKAKDDIAFLKEKVFPINPAKYHGKEFLSFSKCACIGDSLTTGVFNSNSAGYTEYIPIEKYSYPTYMKKHFGIEAVNWGKSGETTKGWYEKAISENWTGYDCAIINLGANDSQLSDSNDSKKYLKMIVDKLKSSNKGIKIFITTLLPNYYSDMGDIRDIVNNRAKEIVAENADCYLVDLTTYSECKKNTVYSQGHLTALGYQKEAEELVAYISYLINQNKNDFKYIHFINTNYSFN